MQALRWGSDYCSTALSSTHTSTSGTTSRGDQPLNTIGARTAHTATTTAISWWSQRMFVQARLPISFLNTAENMLAVRALAEARAGKAIHHVQPQQQGRRHRGNYLA